MATKRHPSAGALEALRDREGPIGSRLATRVHLWRCPSCAARATAAREAAERAGALLAAPARITGVAWPDTEDAWARVMVRSGGSVASITARTRRIGMVGAVTVAAAGLVVAVSLQRWSASDLVTRMYRLSTQDVDTPKRPSRRDVDFGRSVVALEASGRVERLSDVCCADRDGEGPADDGVLTLRLAGSRSPVVILYEDNEHRGRFQPGDVVLNVSRPGLSALAGRLHAMGPDAAGDVRE